MSNYLNIRKQFRRKTGLENFKAVLGGTDGVLDVPNQPGWVYVSYVTASGLSAPVIARFRAVVPKQIGMPVTVGYDEDGELAVLRADFAGQVATGINPLGNNPADDNTVYYINQSRITTLNSHVVSSASASMLVTAEPLIYVFSGTVHQFLGGDGSGVDSTIDLTAYIPGTSNKQCLAALFLKTTDDTIEVITSTPIDMGDQFGLADIQECIDGSSENSIPVWIWHLYNGQVGIAAAPYPVGDDYLDFRGFINVASSAATGTVTSVAESTDASYLTVGGSPITTSGTITLNKTDGLTANQFVATPSGAPGKADLRAIVAADLTSALASPPDIGTTTPAQGWFSALRLKIGGFFGIFTHANTADRTYTLPNASGTVALTSDIPTVAFTAAGDSGTPQTISNGDTLTIAGGTGLSSVASATDTITVNLDDTAVTPASYTNANITVDAQGRITAASNGTDAGITQLTGDVTAGPGSGSQAATLANTAVTPASYTNTSLTVDSKGRITAASNGTNPATLDYWRQVVRATAESNVNIASAPSSIDGVTLTSGDRILLVGQSTGSQNGPWVFNGASSALSRPTDYAAGSTILAFQDVIYWATEGSTVSGIMYRLTTTGAITVDTTATVWGAMPGMFSTLSVRSLLTSHRAVFSSSGLTADRNLTFPDASVQLLGTSSTQNVSNKTITASSLVATALSLLIGGFKAIFSHANTADRTYTFPDYDATVATVAGTETLTNKTLTTPTIGSFTNATHNHQNAAGGGTLDAAAIASGTLALARGGTGQSAASNTALFNAIDPLTTKGDILVHNGTDSVRLAVGANGTQLVADSTVTEGVKWLNVTSFAVIEEQQTSGTAGGASTATTWTTRVLNTEVADADNIVTISSNLFTPIAGTYRIHMVSPFAANATTGTSARIRLWNNTTSAEVARSVNFYISAVATGMNPFLDYTFTANGTDAYALQYYVTAAKTVNGLGLAVSEAAAVERYSRVTLEKIG